MAAALRHKQVRPGMHCLLQRLSDGQTETVRVDWKAPNAINLLFSPPQTAAQLEAAGGDSVIYKDANGNAFKLYSIDAPVPAEPATSRDYSPALHVVAPTVPAEVGLGHSVPAFLTLMTPSGTFRYQVTIEDTTDSEILVRHENGYIRVLRLVSDDHMDCRETDPRVPADYLYRLTLHTASAEKAA